jgi:uncharacterized membrane protein
VISGENAFVEFAYAELAVPFLAVLVVTFGFLVVLLAILAEVFLTKVC